MTYDKTLNVSLIAGPGVGKSTTAAGIFYKLKLLGIDAEIVQEYPKELTWSERYSELENQIQILGKQYGRIHKLQGKVQVVISDSPIILGIVYSHMSEKTPRSFDRLVMDLFSKYHNQVFLLVPDYENREYNPNGRNQSAEVSKEIDEYTKVMLKYHKIPYETVIVDGEKTVDDIVVSVIDNLKELEIIS